MMTQQLFGQLLGLAAAICIGLLLRALLPQGLRKWMRNTIIVTVVIGLGLLAVYIVHSWNRMGYSMSGRTKSTEIVHIKLDGKVPLYIPKAYLTKRREWKGGDQDVLRIEAMLPDMKPVTLASKANENDRIWISLTSVLQQGHSSMVDEIKRLKPYIENTGFGIGKLSERYYPDKKAGKVSGSAYFQSKDHFLVVIDNWRHIRMACEKPAYKCQAYTTFDDILGSYIVDRSYIPERWKEVDDKVITLIKSFRKNPEQEK